MNERQVNEVSSQFPHKNLAVGGRATRASRPMRIRRFVAAVIAAASMLVVGESCLAQPGLGAGSVLRPAMLTGNEGLGSRLSPCRRRLTASRHAPMSMNAPASSINHLR